MATSITDIKNELKGHFAPMAEMAEIREAIKAITTDGASGGDIIQPELDPLLQNMIVKKYPFYKWLESRGFVQDTKSNKPSYLKKLTGGAGSFIQEGGSIPSTTDSTYDLLTGAMTTYVFPIEITDQMRMGSPTDVVDLLQQEIQDGLEYSIQAINAGMLTGTGSSYSMTGLGSLITTHNTDMAGKQITDQFILDKACQDMMDSGGAPAALVTSANVRSQLISILYPNVQIPLVPKQELFPGLQFGYQVASYESPNGDIPIIVDPAMPTTTDQQAAYIVDDSTLRLKFLMRPTVVDLAKTKLTTSQVLASFQSFMCRAEAFNAKITNIGTKTS